ncbi:unnamed protein product [Lepeophtheirus salmonis]|uniref:(salmon louse) hypothetical protein n=1 Tax=Lepeophtheirus salmonis TaxID=72036 RepID=A0A7R8H6R5_LEPSM|nr:unnamed protein product [Lepeophtheirus salmonis]CAF2906929.1 unnamed protein product [Lepeophtheirus salmonis]
MDETKRGYKNFLLDNTYTNSVFNNRRRISYYMALIIMDIIGELYARNQSYFVKMILIYAGHNSVCSCLLTCRSWYNMIRHGIGDWEGLVKRIISQDWNNSK